MDGEDKTARQRKQRLRARREAEGMAQISGWVPAARRAYAREVLQAVAKGANSLPPDPELAAALRAAHEALTRAQAELTAQEEALNDLRVAKAAVEAERDAAKAAEDAAQGKAQAAIEAAAAAQERVTETLGRAQTAEAAIQQVRSLPGLKGRLVRWLAGDALE
jgi:chromosome segregation ATPase